MTEQGKSIASQNALKHGLRAAEWLKFRKQTNNYLRRAREYISDRIIGNY